MIPDRVRITADRIATGSCIVRRRRGAGLASWVRRARRPDLTGVRAALGPLLRLVLLAAAGLGLYGMVRAAPWLMWPLTGVWCWRALRAAPAAPDEAAGEQSEPAARDPSADLAVWLLDTIGDRPGIHLRDLYPQMRHLPGQQDRTDAELRAALGTLGVPVVRSLRIGRIAGRSGIRVQGLVPLLHRGGELAGDTNGDAGQAVDSPGGERGGEGAGEPPPAPTRARTGVA